MKGSNVNNASNAKKVRGAGRSMTVSRPPASCDGGALIRQEKGREKTGTDLLQPGCNKIDPNENRNWREGDDKAPVSGPKEKIPKQIRGEQG